MIPYIQFSITVCILKRTEDALEHAQVLWEQFEYSVIMKNCGEFRGETLHHLKEAKRWKMLYHTVGKWEMRTKQTRCRTGEGGGGGIGSTKYLCVLCAKLNMVTSLYLCRTPTSCRYAERNVYQCCIRIHLWESCTA